MVDIKEFFLKKCSSALAVELHKIFIRKFERRDVHQSFKDNIWDADLADIQ